MATRLLVFANCQSNPLASTLGVMSPDVEIIRCPPVHTIPAAKTDSVFDLLSQADMIVHQPIGQGFGPISSDAIKERFPEKHYASFPSPDRLSRHADIEELSRRHARRGLR
jgi:hypothetical protein